MSDYTLYLAWGFFGGALLLAAVMSICSFATLCGELWDARRGKRGRS